MEDTSQTPSNGHAAHIQWAERICARCRKKFTPLTARERRCAECAAAAASPGPKRRAAKLAARKSAVTGRGKARANGASAGEVHLDSATEVVTSESGKAWTPKPLSATTSNGVLPPSSIATVREWLELGGYKAVVVHTPAGEFLRVL